MLRQIFSFTVNKVQKLVSKEFLHFLKQVLHHNGFLGSLVYFSSSNSILEILTHES